MSRDSKQICLHNKQTNKKNVYLFAGAFVMEFHYKMFIIQRIHNDAGKLTKNQENVITFGSN